MKLMGKVRIWWACARYNFWLDIFFVRRKHRRALRRDLKGNLSAAANEIGISQALANVGGLRQLAASTSRDGEFRSSWYAGAVAASLALLCVWCLFLLVSLYYIAGVVHSGVTERVGSTLLPFFGSTIEVQNSTSELNFEVGVGAGFMPIVAAASAFVIVAKPWRTWRRPPNSASAAGLRPGRPLR